ncbi:ANTAR domain-containing protein [Streptomyces luteogriseus]|uniref:ANTAR domain-containing protein n=1 Tax=Streptomyces luteogriseus TaxID=68233 RepID=UPI0036B8198A
MPWSARSPTPTAAGSRKTTPRSCAWTGTAPKKGEGRGTPGLLRRKRQGQVGEGITQAVDSHATVNRAIGVLIAAHGISPAAAVEVLRDVSEHMNIKLSSVAESVLAGALGQPVPRPVGRELEAVVQRRISGEKPEEPR